MCYIPGHILSVSHTLGNGLITHNIMYSCSQRPYPLVEEIDKKIKSCEYERRFVKKLSSLPRSWGIYLVPGLGFSISKTDTA